MGAEDSVTTSTAFLIGKLGRFATTRFADQIASLGLRPRHCGVLELLRAGHDAQLDIAASMGVSNSVVVNMLDELEELGALRRVRGTDDRRRQHVELTKSGRVLAAKAARAAHQLDKELLAPLDPGQAATLRALLRTLAERHGLSGS